jgi:hypothetical protein
MGIMSNRSMVEFNHDYAPPRDDAKLLEWAKQLRDYIGSADPKLLPRGVTWFGMRHHSEPCPLTPPLGWDNNQKPAA